MKEMGNIIPEGAIRDRIEKLEWLVGKLTLENELLKRLAEQPQPMSKKRQIIRVWGCMGVSIRWGQTDETGQK